jgi:hypothetical protein
MNLLQKILQIKTETTAGANTATRIGGVLEDMTPQVVTTYPETTPEKAGQKFYYKGIEWHYMTQADIDSVEWTGLVAVGFPAPVNKVVNSNILYGSNTYLAGEFYEQSLIASELNALGYGLNNKTTRNLNMYLGINQCASTSNIITVRNFNLLTSLECSEALMLDNIGLSSSIINDVFTQLPPTTKTAYINIIGNPGSETCDLTIATSKGYTVNFEPTPA